MTANTSEAVFPCLSGRRFRRFFAGFESVTVSFKICFGISGDDFCAFGSFRCVLCGEDR